MAILVNPVLALLTVFTVIPQCLALPTATAAVNTAPAEAVPSELCADNATVKNLWTVEGLKVTYASDLTRGSGKSTFKLTNTRTNFSEELSCSLRANYVCEYKGTPADPGLNIWMQLHIETAYVTINQSYTCGGSSTAYAVGMAEVTLTCPDDFYERGLACTGADEEGSASGVVTVSPSSPSSQGLLQRRGVITGDRMPHKIESTGTAEPKSSTILPGRGPKSQRHQVGQKGGGGVINNLDLADELRRKTWKALDSVSFAKRRNGNSQSRGPNGQEPKDKVDASRNSVVAGLYPLAKEDKKLEPTIKVNIEHLCSPSCRGDGPKPPASGWKAPGMMMDQRSIEAIFSGGQKGSGHEDGRKLGQKRTTNPVKPGILLEVV